MRAGVRRQRRDSEPDLPVAQLVEQRELEHAVGRHSVVRDRHAQYQGRIPGREAVRRPVELHELGVPAVPDEQRDSGSDHDVDQPVPGSSARAQ